MTVENEALVKELNDLFPEIGNLECAEGSVDEVIAEAEAAQVEAPIEKPVDTPITTTKEESKEESTASKSNEEAKKESTGEVTTEGQEASAEATEADASTIDAAYDDAMARYDKLAAQILQMSSMPKEQPLQQPQQVREAPVEKPKEATQVPEPTQVSAPVTRAAQQEWAFVTEANHEEVLNSPNGFNTVLSAAVRAAVQLSLSTVVPIVQQIAAQEVENKSTVERFYNENPGLAKYRNLVTLVSQELVRENSGITTKELFEQLPKAIEERYKIKIGAREGSQKAEKKPAFAKASGTSSNKHKPTMNEVEELFS